jgi:flagellar biosynthesis regulator FlaF
MYEFAYNEVIEDPRQTMRARERQAMDRVIAMLRAAQENDRARGRQTDDSRR